MPTASSTRRTKNGREPKRSLDVLTLGEAAKFLRTSDQNVLDLVASGEIFGRQIGGEWRFLRANLESWLSPPSAKGPNENLLALAGSWKDDPDIESILADIYRKRGRPMLEDQA